jgi:hypothetical protein
VFRTQITETLATDKTATAVAFSSGLMIVTGGSVIVLNRRIVHTQSFRLRKRLVMWVGEEESIVYVRTARFEISGARQYIRNRHSVAVDII